MNLYIVQRLNISKVLITNVSLFKCLFTHKKVKVLGKRPGCVCGVEAVGWWGTGQHPILLTVS